MKFDKANIKYEGTNSDVWVKYENKVVARFKHARPKSNAKDFVKFLVANFTVDEYFEKKETMSPIRILEEKGYVCLNVRKMREAAQLMT